MFIEVLGRAAPVSAEISVWTNLKGPGKNLAHIRQTEKRKIIISPVR